MKVIRVIVSQFETNAYILLTQKPAIIDPGTYADNVLSKLDEYKINPEYIILTHGHYDHAGNISTIRNRTKAKLAMHELEFDFFNEYKPRVDVRYEPIEQPIEISLKGGETLDLGNYKLDVIHTPGHTPGSICLYERKTKGLFSGDTVFPNGSFGRTDFEGGNQQQMIDSLKLLSKLDVRILYPGHGEVTKKDVNKQIKSSLQLAQL